MDTSSSPKEKKALSRETRKFIDQHFFANCMDTCRRTDGKQRGVPLSTEAFAENYLDCFTKCSDHYAVLSKYIDKK